MALPVPWSGLVQSWLSAGSQHIEPSIGLNSVTGGASDAFSRLRVSDPTTLFDSQMEYDANPLLWVEKATGTGAASFSQAKAQVDFSVAAGDSIIRQSRAYMRYQPGKSQLVILTGNLGAATAGVVKRIGYFDDENGVFVQLDGDGLSFVLRSSTSGTPTDEVVAQADWNTDTQSDLDTTKAQIIIFDLEWLGVGRVRCGFYRDGLPVIAHQFLNTNRKPGVYMATANLPVRYEMVSTTGAASDMAQICASVISEGGFEEDRGIPFAVNTGVVGQACGTAGLIPVMSLRMGTAFAGKVARGQLLPESVDLYVTGAACLYEIHYGGVVGGASYAQVNASSLAEYDVAGTALTGSFALEGGFVAATGTNPTNRRGSDSKTLVSKLPLSLDVDGENPIPITVMAQGIGDTATVYANIGWRELR